MSKRLDTWMPFYVRDYYADTQHLSCEQHGAYILLILACWSRGGQLPNDENQLAAIVRLPLKQWRAMRSVIMPFFIISDEFLTHKRIVKELQKANTVSEKRSAAGKAGGRPPNSVTNKSNCFSLALQTESKPEPNEEANGKQTETHARVASPLRYATLQPQELQEGEERYTATQPFLDKPNAINARGLKKIITNGSGISVAGVYSDQRARDEYAVGAIVPHLPGRDDGERWAIAMAAEDPTDPGHQSAVLTMLKVAKAAGVGWISPERRGKKLA